MPTARYHAVSGVLGDGTLCVAGGDNRGKDGGFTSIMERYNPKTQEWSTCTPMPSACGGGVGGVLGDGKFYVIGSASAQYTDPYVTECYDPHTQQWSAFAPMPGHVDWRDYDEASYAGVVMHGQLYVLGGHYISWTDFSGEFLDVASARVHCYDPQTGRWSETTPMPTARCDALAHLHPQCHQSILMKPTHHSLLGVTQLQQCWMASCMWREGELHTRASASTKWTAMTLKRSNGLPSPPCQPHAQVL